MFAISVSTLPFSLRPREEFGLSRVPAKLIHVVGVRVGNVLEIPGEKDSGVTGTVSWLGSLQCFGF